MGDLAVQAPLLAQPRRRVSRRRRSLFALLMIAGLAVMTIALFEVVLRIVPMFMQQPMASFLQEADRIALCNTRLYGGTSIWMPTTTQADMLVVGDSFPFGTNCRAGESFPAQFAELTDLGVVNLGVPSMAPPEYNRMLEVGMRFSPKRVLYCVFANDFRYDAPVEIRKLSIENASKSLPGDRRLFAESLSITDRARQARTLAMNPFLSIQLLKLARLPNFNVEHVIYEDDDLAMMFMPREWWDPQLSWKTPEVQEATRTNAALIKEAADFCKNQGADFLVLLIPPKEMVYSPGLDIEKKVFDTSHGETYDQLKRMLSDQKIECLDLTTQLRELARQNVQLYFTIDGHFNERGNELVAGILKDFLDSRGSQLRPNKDVSGPLG
jgi:hypothetical protein